ncbi:hypothetical protein ADK54_05145 [Streptomyces sp. WM6378]|nr:hypothetical protein ADK54_05145 [Streptomyces sp. WM6378]
MEALMDGCFLDEATGVGVNFDSAILTRAGFGDCDFSDIDFSAADLWGSQWVGSSVDNANFELADLRFSVMMNTTMGDSVFSRAKMALAQIAGSSYPDSDFEEADLDFLLLVAGDLGSAKGVDAALLGEVMIGGDVKLPQGISGDPIIIDRRQAYGELKALPILRRVVERPQCCLDEATMSHRVGMAQTVPGDDERDDIVRSAIKGWPRGVKISVSL